jgi:hypothetical protein
MLNIYNKLNECIRNINKKMEIVILLFIELSK